MLTLDELMTRKVVTVESEATLEQVRAMFLTSRFHHLVVVKHGRVIGVVSDRDLLKHISPFVGTPPRSVSKIARRFRSERIRS